MSISLSFFFQGYSINDDRNFILDEHLDKFVEDILLSDRSTFCLKFIVEGRVYAKIL